MVGKCKSTEFECLYHGVGSLFWSIDPILPCEKMIVFSILIKLKHLELYLLQHESPLLNMEASIKSKASRASRLAHSANAIS